MPIYEYECPLCGQFEVMQGMNDKPVKCKPDCCEKNCPKKAQRLISSSAFHLVGGGWYKSDYGGKSSSGSAAKAADSKGADSGEKGATASSEKSDSAAKKCKPGCGCH